MSNNHKRKLKYNRLKNEKARKVQIKLTKKKKGSSKKKVSHSRAVVRENIRADRAKIRKELYKKFQYKNVPITVQVTDQLGIETRGGVEKFLDVAEQVIDFDAKELKIDVGSCTRMWPSAVTMLCSLVEWITLSKRKSHHPRIGSNTPQNRYVEDYLSDCGFYDYVGRINGRNTTGLRADDRTVKIKLEIDTSKIDEREDEIQGLIATYSLLDAEQVEYFTDRALMEIFLNVTEHGIASNRNMGYWLLAQYHERTGIISLCIADNGIGIRNTLMTGPQKEELAEKIERLGIQNSANFDGEFIKMALEESVSGALTAFPKRDAFVIMKGYEKGSRRGNGFSRIKDACRKLGISLSILSQNGYVFIDSSGKIYNHGSRERRIFAGTLYHMSIPAKKREE